MNTLDLLIGLRHLTCCHKGCKMLIVMSSTLYDQLKKSRESFFCLNGHSQYFSGENDADKIRNLERRLASKQNLLNTERARRERVERSRNVYKGKLNATKTRIKNGVCPCCKRTFQNLGRHMATQHPKYAAKGKKE